MSKTPLVKTNFCPAARRRARSARSSSSERILVVDICEQSSTMRSVPGAVATGSRAAGPVESARTMTRSLPLPVLTSSWTPAFPLFTIYDLPFTIIVSVQDDLMTVPFLEDNDQTRARREHLEALRRL